LLKISKYGKILNQLMECP